MTYNSSESDLRRRWRNILVQVSIGMASPNLTMSDRGGEDGFSDVMSEADFDEIIYLLSQKELETLFQALEINPNDVEIASTTYADIRTMLLFRLWKQRNGKQATRQVVLDTLVKCGMIKVKARLQDTWNKKKLLIMASDLDFSDVATCLGSADLHRLFQASQIPQNDVENAELDANTSNVYLRAVSVLHWWRRGLGREATRQAIIDALDRCKNIEAKESLLGKWIHNRVDSRTHSTSTSELFEFYDMIKPLGPDELKVVYRNLGISRTDVRKAEEAERSNEVDLKARAVIRFWKTTNGRRATSAVLSRAMQQCKNTKLRNDLKEIPDPTLSEIRRQLMNEYEATRGKVPLLPGMPEKCAEMDDLFVDLDITQEGQSSGTITYRDLVCIERKKEQKGCIKGKVKRVLVKGKPGVGKSIIISKLAYDWACSKQDLPISNFKLLFAIAINEIDTDKDFIDIIRDQLLPNVSCEDLRVCIQNYSGSIVILLDGFDEASEQFYRCKDIGNILRNKWLPEACVIVTTRQTQVSKFFDIFDKYGSYLQVDLQGLSESNRQIYIENFVRMKNKQGIPSGDESCPDKALRYDENRTNAEDSVKDNYEKMKAQTFIDRLRKTPSYQLSAIPIVLSLLCLLGIEDEELPSTITGLYTNVIMYLAKHNSARNASHEYKEVQHIDALIEDVLYRIGRVAIDGLIEDRIVFEQNEFDEKGLHKACELGIVTIERRRSRLAMVNRVTFIHKAFQEICAASYLGKEVQLDPAQFDKYLKLITIERVPEMQYVLRFTCGSNIGAAEIILPRLIKAMIGYARSHQQAETVFKYANEQIPVFLLYEAEMNCNKRNRCQVLHEQMQSVYSSVCINSKWILACKQAIEFDDILNFYIDSQHDPERSSTKSWLDHVRKLTVEDEEPLDHDNVNRVARLLCSMSNVSVLRLRYACITPFLGVLMSNQSLASLSELQLWLVESDADKLSEFLSAHPSLRKVDLYNVSIYGESRHPITLDLKEMSILVSPESTVRSEGMCKAFLQGFSESAKKIEQQRQGHSSGDRMPSQRCLSLQDVQIGHVTFDDDCVSYLVSAMKYMVELKCLALPRSNLGPNAWKRLFEAFGYRVSFGRPTSGHGRSSYIHNWCGELVEELDFSENNIGDSVATFVDAYRSMQRLKCLSLNQVSMERKDFQMLFDGFITCQIKQEGLQELHLSKNDIGSAVEKLGQAYRYMADLKIVDLHDAKLNSSDCAQLFAGIWEAGELMVKRSEANDPEAILKQRSLALEELHISCNEVGDAVDEFVEAYKYLTRLKRLNLSNSHLDPSHCERLFEGFVEVGQELAQQSDNSSTVQEHDASSTESSNNCLGMEILNLSQNDIGKSVEKLLVALKYMPHLKALLLGRCQLEEDDRKKVEQHLKMINNDFVENGVGTWKLELN